MSAGSGRTEPPPPPASPGAPGEAAAPESPEAPEATRTRVRDVLEQEVARVDTPAAADAIAEQLERLAAGKTEAEQGDRSAASARPAAAQLAATAAATDDEPAAVLLKAAQTAAAETPEGAAVVRGALDVMEPGAAPAPAVERGRTLLKEAVLRRMGPLQRLDARVYLTVNGIPHAPWSDRLANGITVWTTGGWVWSGGVLLARLAGVPHAGAALRDVLPSVAVATWIVEHPVKALFRRRRPFVDVVRALVVGKKPGSWSFPSGHTAASFAAAWVLSKSWPRRAPLFFGLAGLVGGSRVYVGAHYPGDVLVGAGAGMVLAELANRLNRALRTRWR